jgi:hypothetical protein
MIRPNHVYRGLRHLIIMMIAEKYQTCMLLSGGGFRYGYYLGMHAAVVERYKAPNLLLGTCGGAIAAAIIQGLPDDQQRKNWIASEQMYEFWRTLKANPQAKFTRALWGATKRKFTSKHAIYIPDLFNDYLFEIQQYVPLPTLETANPEIAVAVIAGKLLYTQAEIGQQRGNKKLFKEIIFCNEKSSDLLAGMPSSVAHHDNAIDSQLLIDTQMPINEAARASVSDMFYFRCHSYQANHYVGGAINLLPIEIAKCLAHETIIEIKSPYDQSLSIPALQAVFGINGNQRLREVAKQVVTLAIDTSDMQTALKSARIQKRINWRENQIELMAPPSYKEYVRMIDAQWQYGYDRATHAIKTSGNRLP